MQNLNTSNIYCSVLLCNCRVKLIVELDSYHYYLKFAIKVRFNDLLYLKKYTQEQLETYKLIQSLRKKGLRYRRVARYFNEKEILTTRKTKWNCAKVHSVLKRYKERVERIKKVRNKKYQTKWVSKMELVYE